MATTTDPAAHLSADVPAMVIRALTPSITIFSMPFTRHGSIHFGLRCTAVRLRTGSLAIFSACPLTPTVLAALTSISPDPQVPTAPNVRYLIAPDTEHHLNIGPWKKAFPRAHILAPEGLREKLAEQGHADAAEPYAHVWAGAPRSWTDEDKFGTLPAEFKDEFDIECFDTHETNEVAFLHRLDGDSLIEIAFLHRPDGGSLIEADLFFNLPALEQFSATNPPVDPTRGFSSIVLNHLGAGPELDSHGAVIPGSTIGHRRLLWWLFTTKNNRRKLAESAKVVSGWEFSRIIPCHGEVAEDGDQHKGRAKDMWDDVFRWHLDLLS